jgi:hypothetical protein
MFELIPENEIQKENRKFLGRIGKSEVSINTDTKTIIVVVYDTALKKPEEKALIELRFTKFDARHLHDALHLALPYVE